MKYTYRPASVPPWVESDSSAVAAAVSPDDVCSDTAFATTFGKLVEMKAPARLPAGNVTPPTLVTPAVIEAVLFALVSSISANAYRFPSETAGASTIVQPVHDPEVFERELLMLWQKADALPPASPPLLHAPSRSATATKLSVFTMTSSRLLIDTRHGKKLYRQFYELWRRASGCPAN